jgi:hypothetical protein
MAVAVPLFLGRLACWVLDISVVVVAILMLRVFAALRAGLWTAVAAGGLGYVVSATVCDVAMVWRVILRWCGV